MDIASSFKVSWRVRQCLQLRPWEPTHANRMESVSQRLQLQTCSRAMALGPQAMALDEQAMAIDHQALALDQQAMALDRQTMALEEQAMALERRPWLDMARKTNTY